MNQYTVGFKHIQLTEKIISVFYDVYNELGFGFLESVYEQAMCIAMRQIGLRVECQVPIKVYFRGVEVGLFKADVLVEGVILLEFGPKPEVKRVAFDNDRKVPSKKYKPPEDTNSNV